MEVDIEEIIEMIIMKDVGVGPEKDSIQETLKGMSEVVVVVGPDQVQELSTNRNRIRCYKCREDDHFAKDCQTSKIEKETEQIQHMYNMEEELYRH